MLDLLPENLPRRRFKVNLLLVKILKVWKGLASFNFQRKPKSYLGGNWEHKFGGLFQGYCVCAKISSKFLLRVNLAQIFFKRLFGVLGWGLIISTSSLELFGKQDFLSLGFGGAN